jgi:hypothetical protein
MFLSKKNWTCWADVIPGEKYWWQYSLEVSASRWAISRVVSGGAGRAGGGEVAVAAVGVVEGGVGERVMVMSIATREMGCGGDFLKEEDLGVKPTSAGRLVHPSMCVLVRQSVGSEQGWPWGEFSCRYKRGCF